MFIAISAGNEFEDGNPTEVFAEIASRVKGAVSVGAIDRAHNRAYYSSSGTWVELAAPGGSFRGFGDCGKANSGGILQHVRGKHDISFRGNQRRRQLFFRLIGMMTFDAGAGRLSVAAVVLDRMVLMIERNLTPLVVETIGVQL